MKVWAESNPKQYRPKLKPLLEAYEDWIDREEQRIADPAEGLTNFKHVAEQAAVALVTAAKCEYDGRLEESVEIVWTGPEPAETRFRQTEQAILEVVNSATNGLTVVSYAVYRIPRIRDALAAAARPYDQLCQDIGRYRVSISGGSLAMRFRRCTSTDSRPSAHERPASLTDPCLTILSRPRLRPNHRRTVRSALQDTSPSEGGQTPDDNVSDGHAYQSHC